MQRRAYQLKAGNLANLKQVTEQLPEPAPGEVTVAVQAIGLNFADILAIPINGPCCKRKAMIASLYEAKVSSMI